MIVFQVKGQSHRLSKLKGKEKDVINLFSEAEQELLMIPTT